MDLAQLQALAAAVEAGTLDGAARLLHVTPSAVSQRLRALESATGQVLLVRSRPVVPTKAGAAVLRLARQVQLLVADTTAQLAGSAAPGPPVLPVAVNADSLATWFLPAVAPLADRVQLDVRVADQTLTSALLRDGTVMAAVTADPVAVPGCSVRPLGAMRYLAVATPEVAQRWRSDPASAPVVVFDRDDDLQDDWLAARAGEAHRLEPPRHHVPASVDFSEAVRLGWGWALLPQAHAAADLESGRFELLDAAPVDVPLFWQQWKLRSPALDAVAAALASAARSALVPPP